MCQTVIIAASPVSPSWAELIIPRIRTKPWAACSVETLTLGFERIPGFESIVDGTPSCVLASDVCKLADEYVRQEYRQPHFRIMSQLHGPATGITDGPLNKERLRISSFLPPQGELKRVFYLTRVGVKDMDYFMFVANECIEIPALTMSIYNEVGSTLLGPCTMELQSRISWTTASSFEEVQAVLNVFDDELPDVQIAALVEF